MAYIIKTLYIDWIFEHIAKTATQFHFPFTSYKPVSEPAAWLPDPYLDMDETYGVAKLRPPLNCVVPYQAFEAAGFGQDLPRHDI